jgi:hypothetical protein
MSSREKKIMDEQLSFESDKKERVSDQGQKVNSD